MIDINFKEEVLQAVQRVSENVRKTPLEYSPSLSKKTGAQVYFKTENYQKSGSFKIRGAFNKLSVLSEDGIKEVITASTGNHAEAVANACDALGMNAKIYLPENIKKSKLTRLQDFKSVFLELVGNDCIISEQSALESSKLEGIPYVSPYNDREIVTGQGTIGYEIYDDLKEVDCVFVPVGGGGMISGIAGYLKSINKNIEIIGCQPENSKVMYESVKAGKILNIPSLPTVSDGTAGGVEQGSITFDLIKEYVDDFVIVSENEIIEALKSIILDHNMLVEGSAGLSLAALNKTASKYRDKNVVLILCGNKIDKDLLKKLVC